MKNRLRIAPSVLAALALSVIALVAASASSRADGDPVKPVTVVLVRHAETAGSTKTERDPALSEEGVARAGKLAKLFSNAGITHLFSTPFERTTSTLAALAKSTELDVVTVGPGDAGKQLDKLRALEPGSIAVVAGHSNTVPQMVKALGGEVGELDAKGYLDHDEHGRLFVITLPAGDGALTQVVELYY